MWIRNKNKEKREWVRKASEKEKKVRDEKTLRRMEEKGRGKKRKRK